MFMAVYWCINIDEHKLDIWGFGVVWRNIKNIIGQFNDMVFCWYLNIAEHKLDIRSFSVVWRTIIILGT